MTLVGAGKCTIRAAQAGNATYAAAPNVDQSFSIAKASQTITFAPPGNQTFDASPLTIDATASSGLPITFASTTASVCAVAGSAVTFIKQGKCSIRASQAGNANYKAATSVNQSFTIAKGNQAIAFGPLGNRTIGTPPFTISATATSGLAVSFASLTPPVCTENGGTVTLVAVGGCTIRAAQPGNLDWNAAPTVDQSFDVTLVSQTITFDTLPDQTLGAPPFTAYATASSGLPVGFASLSTQVCTVSGTSVTLVAAGTCTIRAAQAGDAMYAAAPNVDRSFAIAANANLVTRYSYDAAGNLIGVRRVPAP